MSETIVVKIGGSTLGRHDTTLDDVVALRQQGLRPVVVHGGGAMVSLWMEKLGLPARFVRGLRVTNSETLDVAVAVLAGLVNKQLVAALAAKGAQACGMSGADSGLLRAAPVDRELGLVGEIRDVQTGSILALLETGVIPMIAPIALNWQADTTDGQLLNVNADAVAGAIAAALAAHWLVFLTDVPGILNAEGRLLESVSTEEGAALLETSVVTAGMIPKVQACLEAGAAGVRCLIIDGREPHSLLAAVSRSPVGTVVGS